MRTRWMVSGALLAALSSTYAIAGEPETLAKTSAWEMNYDDDACHLAARFGNDGKRVILQLTRFGPSDHMGLRLFGPRFSGVHTVHAEAKVAFEPILEKIGYTQLTTGDVAKLPMVFGNMVRLDNLEIPAKGEDSFPNVAPAREAQVNALSVAIRGLAPFKLALGPMTAPMQAMHKCTDSLVRKWGFDPQELATRTRRAKPNGTPYKWLTDGDYPSSMAFKGQGAIVAFRLKVGADGAPQDCVIQQTTNPPEIGPLVCKLLMQRAKFIPALDKGGEPVADVYFNRTIWQIRP